MKKRLLSAVLAVCLLLTLVPAVSAAQAPNTFDAYLTMSALREKYPEGTPWTNDNTYAWKGGIFTHGAGCAAFAFMLSDAVFGELPARQLTGVAASDLRPGDILRMNGDTHSVIVLQNTEYGIVVAEGNYNSSIHWDRVLSTADAESADYVLTRYPEGWREPARQTPPLETAAIMNEFTLLQKRFPQGMRWDYDYSYYWNGGIYDGSGGSYAFAMLLSDAIFGDLPACAKQGMTLEQLRVGDIVVDRSGAAGIVTKKLGDHAVLAEGQDGGIVNWDRSLSAQALSEAHMVLTRYPDAQPSVAEKTLEEKAQDAMLALQDDYPESKPWSNADSYTWKGVPGETGHGCFAFAYILSDGAFGSLPARKVTDFTMADIRAGDILVMQDYSVIVLSAYLDCVMIAEGEYNGGIHWGRFLEKAEVESADYMLTRYPADYQDTNRKPGADTPAGTVVESGSCGLKNQPVRWVLTEDGTLTIYGVYQTDNYNYNMGYHLTPWYDYRASVTRVVVREGIMELGSFVFANMPNLTEVILPSSLKKIGMDCFSGCTSLETLRLPQGVTELDNRAFQGCTALKNINFPTSLESIGSNCFALCSALASAELKEGVAYLGSGAFAKCGALETAVLPGSLGNNIQNTFSGCDNLSTVVLGEGVTELGRSFAENCSSLKQVFFPATLQYIGEDAFRGSGLVEVTLPGGLTYLGDRAFSSCLNLETVTINHNVESFGNNVFSYCDGLKNLNIGENVTYIGKSTFMGCDGLTELVLPGTLGRVEVNMFCDIYGGDSMVAVLEEGITSVARNAFNQCTNLKEVHLPASLTLIEENAFDRNADFWEMTFYYYGTPEQWAAVEIRDGNFSLEYAAFIFAEPGQCTHARGEEIPGRDANCTEPGLTAGKACATCGQVLEEQKEVPALGHAWDGNTCTRCGLVREGLLGDVDGDGRLSYQDALQVLRASINLAVLEDESVADIDGDGRVTYQDALKILRKSINLE